MPLDLSYLGTDAAERYCKTTEFNFKVQNLVAKICDDIITNASAECYDDFKDMSGIQFDEDKADEMEFGQPFENEVANKIRLALIKTLKEY
jgi:hypothetical protein